MPVRTTVVSMSFVLVVIVLASAAKATVLDTGDANHNPTQNLTLVTTAGLDNAADGKTSARAQLQENTPAVNYLLQVQDSTVTNATRAAFLASAAPTSTTFTASADLSAAGTDSGYRIGVIVMDTNTNKGVAFYLRGASGFRIAELNFNTPTTSEIVLDGGATISYNGITATNTLNGAITVSPNAGTPADADITVKLIQSSLTASITLTNQDLSAYLPFSDVAAFKVGYWGYDGGGLATGDAVTMGTVDNLSLSPVPEPSKGSVIGLGAAALLVRRRRHA